MDHQRSLELPQGPCLEIGEMWPKIHKWEFLKILFNLKSPDWQFLLSVWILSYASGDGIYFIFRKLAKTQSLLLFCSDLSLLYVLLGSLLLSFLH